MIIINLQDTVTGSWHQATVDHTNTVRLDGHLLYSGLTEAIPDNEFAKRCLQVALSWEDQYEGLEVKEDGV